VFYVETMRGDPALAAFATPAEFVAFQRDSAGRAPERHAVAVALLRAYESAPRDRGRLGVLVLLAVWSDVAGLVRGKTRQLVRRAGFTRSDADDVEQEIALDLLKRLPRFDPSKASLRTFATRIVEHHVATLIESREAPCRDWRRAEESLDELIPDDAGEVVPRWRTFDEEECAGRRRGDEPDERAARGLRIDVADAFVALDPALRDVAERLCVSTPTEVARATGRPRTTVYESIARIRDAFGDAGLSAYVPTLRRALR
jgi:RNA polymerase sigma-70 factor, ECF subfamily